MNIVSKGTSENPKFMVDNSVIIRDIRDEKGKIAYSFDYDENMITEKKAIKLAAKAMQRIIDSVNQRHNDKINTENQANEITKVNENEE